MILNKLLRRRAKSSVRDELVDWPSEVERSEEENRARILARWLELSRRANEVDRDRRKLRKSVEAIPDGVYGEYRKSHGEPGEVLDQDQVRERYVAYGLDVPMKQTAAPLEVSRVEGS